ncbi:MAG: transporter ATP-binding protein [Aeromicrobium sp.]|nr:transporter ATP-binding protein [Aeromicrobium sp.]
MPEPVVIATGLHKSFRSPQGARFLALEDVSFSANAGELTAITGPSGSGKSTLLQVLAGLDRPDSGTVMIAGHRITGLGDRALSKLRRQRFGFVFQSFNLIGSLSARANIALPLELDGREADEDRLEELAASLGLSDRLDHYPGQLSGGEQQRVAVARALLLDPDVVFADEPTGALDPDAARKLTDLLVAVAHKLGQAVVVVSHDPRLAERCDRVFRMHAGRLSDGEDVSEGFAMDSVRP